MIKVGSLVLLYSLILLFSFSAESQNTDRVDSLLLILEIPDSVQQKIDAYNKLAFEYVNVDSAKTRQYALQAIGLAKANNYTQGIADAYIQIGWTIFRSGNYDSAIYYLKEALELASKANYKKGQAEAKHGIGSVLTDKGDFENAILELEEALSINEEINHQKGIALTYNQLGILNAYRGDYRTCLEFFLKALDIQLQLGDKQKIAGNYNNIAIVYEQLNEQEKALEFFLKALHLNEKLNDKRGISLNYVNIIPIYIDMGRLDEAMKFAQQSLEISEEIGSKSSIAYSLSNLGFLYSKKKDHAKALTYFKQSLDINKELGDPSAIAVSLSQLSNVLIELERYEEAIKNLLRADKIAQEVGNAGVYTSILSDLSDAYRSVGNYKKAFQTHVRYKQMSDSLINDDKKEEIAHLEAQFEFKQEKDSLAIIQAQERAAYEADIAARETKQLITYVSLVVLLVFLFVIGYLYRSNRKATLEIVQQRDDLQRMNRTKTRLFSIISHDLRAPMSVFIGFFDILIDHIKSNYEAEADPEFKKIRSHLHETTDRVLHLMDDMVEWAKKEEGTISYHPETLIAEHLIEETQKLVEPQALAKGITINSSVNGGLSLWADKNCCKTIFRNLLSNAIKFTPIGGVIKLSANQVDGHIRINVEDTGIGIPKDQLSDLFDLHKDKVRKGTKGELGLGLGLNIVFEFVKMNKGDIHVVSEEGKGTSFVVSLPRTKAS